MKRQSIYLFAFLSFFLIADLSAQRTKPGSGSRNKGNSRTLTAPPVATTPSFNSGRSYAPSRRNMPMGSRSTGFSSRRNSIPKIPTQTYGPGFKVNYGGWISTWEMLRYLSYRYSFLNLSSSAWRYAQGDSPLTQEMIQVGLLKPVSASSSLLAMSDDLMLLIDKYERGQISRKDFRDLMKARTKAIRSFAKTIRNDYFLDYLDQTDNKAKVDVDKARSIAELRQLCSELRNYADQVDEGLSSFYEHDMSRLVAVSELQRPSFESLSKGIDKIAKTIEKSAKRL